MCGISDARKNANVSEADCRLCFPEMFLLPFMSPNSVSTFISETAAFSKVLLVPIHIFMNVFN